MSSGQTGLILEYMDLEDCPTPQAKVYWVGEKEVVSHLKEIVKRRKVTSIDRLDAIVDLVQTDGNFEIISSYLSADSICFEGKE